MSHFPKAITAPPNGALVFLGDIHGDPWPLLEALENANVGLKFSERLWQVAAKCYCGSLPGEKVEVGAGDVSANRPVSVVWLGDITDGRRGNRPTLGGCADSHTLGLTLDICNAVAGACKDSGGRAVLVLGNHDMANIGDDTVHLCKRYAHQTSADDQGTFATCDAEGLFVSRHMKMVKDKLSNLEWCVCLAIKNFGLAVHGFVCQGLLDALSMLLDKALPNTCVEAADLLNRTFAPLYAPATIKQRTQAEKIAKSLRELTPWWCRPSITGVTPPNFTNVIVKGHCVAPPGTCEEIGDCLVYYADCAMSAAFDSPKMVAQSLVMNEEASFTWHIIDRPDARLRRKRASCSDGLD